MVFIKDVNSYYCMQFYIYIFKFISFFSLLKLIFCFARKHQDIPPCSDIEHAVRRNFSGLEELDTWSIFKSFLPPILQLEVKENVQIKHC